jgi:hypothetical protein
VGEGGIAIGVEKPLAGGERFDENVVEPTPSIVADDFVIAPATKVRQFVDQNEGSEFVRHAWSEEAQAQPNVAAPGGPRHPSAAARRHS